MSKNKEKVGSRWVDMYPATKGELYAYQETQRPKVSLQPFAARVATPEQPWTAPAGNAVPRGEWLAAGGWRGLSALG